MRYLGTKDVEPPNVVVDRAGNVHLPLVGDAPIADRTLSEAERIVQTKLRRYDRFSTVSITVLETKARQATVTGAVEHPGNVPLVGDARLADVLGAAGGPKTATMLDRAVSIGDVEGNTCYAQRKSAPC